MCFSEADISFYFVYLSILPDVSGLSSGKILLIPVTLVKLALKRLHLAAIPLLRSVLYIEATPISESEYKIRQHEKANSFRATYSSMALIESGAVPYRTHWI